MHRTAILTAFDLLILTSCLIHLGQCQLMGILLNNPSFALDSHRTNGRSTLEVLHSDEPDSREQNGTVLVKCKQDSDCIDDNSTDTENLMYCDHHYGFCDFFRAEGELCRHDSQCDSGLLCMFGRCAKALKPGQKGARCRDASECATGLCCARQHGEHICKPKLKPGQQCFVPLGGLDYSLNELCPCEEGLACQSVKAKNKRFVLQRKVHIVMHIREWTYIRD